VAAIRAVLAIHHGVTDGIIVVGFGVPVVNVQQMPRSFQGGEVKAF
jgi:hypothetical protein